MCKVCGVNDKLVHTVRSHIKLIFNGISKHAMRAPMASRLCMSLGGHLCNLPSGLQFNPPRP